jgi:ATP-dependent Zn protease
MANNNPRFKKNNVFKRFPVGLLFLVILLVMLINSVNVSVSGIPGVPREITYSTFYKVLKDNPDKIKYVNKTETLLQGEFTDNSKFFVNIPDNDTELLNLMRQNLKNFDVKPPRTFWAALLLNLGPILLLIFFWWFMAARGE